MGSSKFSAAGSYRYLLEDWKKMRRKDDILNSFELQTEKIKEDLLLAGSLKTLVPSIRFGGDELLFNVWMLVKTPDEKCFPTLFYYGASGTSLGGWRADLMNPFSDEKVFPEELESIINFSPFDFYNEELNHFLDALEFALKKVPISDFRGVYKHDMGESYMKVDKGKPKIW